MSPMPAPTSSRTRAGPSPSTSTMTNCSVSAPHSTVVGRNTPARSPRFASRRSPGRDSPRSSTSVGGHRKTQRTRRERAPRTLQDQAANSLARTTSGEIDRDVASAEGEQWVFPRKQLGPALLHVLGWHPEGSRSAWPPHPRLPAHMDLAERHERRQAHHRPSGTCSNTASGRPRRSMPNSPTLR